MKMASEMLERLVMPHLNGTRIDYAFISENAVKTKIAGESSGGRFIAAIFDWHMAGLDMLQFMVYQIAQFPEERTPHALAVCNKLQQKLAMGALQVDRRGNVNYLLGLPVTDRSEPEDFILMLRFTVSMLNMLHPLLMAARWGGTASFERALERWSRDYAEREGERGRRAGESGEPPPLSDDEIAKLLEMLEAEDGEEGS